MQDVTGLVDLTAAQFAAVVALFLPGFVSLKIDRLMTPGARPGTGELVLEAFGYSLINAGLLSWPILLTSSELANSDPDYGAVAVNAALVCVAGPIAWPIMFRRFQAFGAKKGWLLGRHRYAWDAFFSRKEPCWVILHLPTGALVGGYFGRNSYATVEPNSGDIYLEELWRLDAEGRFVTKIEKSKGALFRAGGYSWLEVFWDQEQANDKTKSPEAVLTSTGAP